MNIKRVLSLLVACAAGGLDATTWSLNAPQGLILIVGLNRGPSEVQRQALH